MIAQSKIASVPAGYSLRQIVLHWIVFAAFHRAKPSLRGAKGVFRRPSFDGLWRRSKSIPGPRKSRAARAAKLFPPGGLLR